MKPRINMPKSKNRPESEDKLLLAAKEVFSEYGYEGATTRMIAEKAGINLALIARYFGNKHGLLLALVERGARDIGSRPLPYPAQNTLLQECLCYAECMFSFHLEHEAMLRIVIIQSLTDRSFSEAMRKQNPLETRSNIKSRLAPFFENPPVKEGIANITQLLEFMNRQIFASIFLQFIIRGEPKKKCLEELKALITKVISSSESDMEKN